MKGEITLKILETLGEAAVGAAELFAAIMVAGYGASPNRISYIQEKIHAHRAQEKRGREHEAQLRRKYSNLLSKLKREGLIAERKKGEGTFLSLTFLGARKRDSLRSRHAHALPPPHYRKEQGTRLLIVAFDVPEKERRKRDWLRSALHNLGLIRVQKSMWLGKIKIPKELLKDIQTLGLVEFVEIFEVGNAGSLRHII
ncbi:MAG: CRISPR-associated endonuclease Cas2 [Candidatus Liptonbacteria bacterium]|nr:CRISPR-associated endonuclease Cas2 [Candidatus Liptonbacteria bacterium]